MDQKLGRKTLMIFILQRINASMVLLLVAIGLAALQGQSFLERVPVPHFGHYISLASWGVFAVFGVFFVLAFLIGWLHYITYRFSLGDDALTIKRGIINKEEISIPYRQIQDVNIERDLSFQMMGLSRIVILTAGHEDEKKTKESGEAEGILPALDKDTASWLQGELMKRANIQKVVQSKP